MEIGQILEIIKYILLIILGGISLYYKTTSHLNGMVSEYIDKAEDMYKDTVGAGGKRFEWVVNQLYNIIPTFLKPVITRQTIANIVQSSFDIIKNYAEKELDSVVKKISVNNGDGK